MEAYDENTDQGGKRSFDIYVKLSLDIINLLPINIQCLIDVRFHFISFSFLSLL